MAVAYLCSMKTNKFYKGFRELNNCITFVDSLDLIKEYYTETGEMHRETAVKLKKMNDISNEEINAMMPKGLIIEKDHFG